MNANAAVVISLSNQPSIPQYSMKCVPLDQFMKLDIPSTDYLLEPWLRSNSLNMIHARRGVGKTHVGLGIAHAVSTGTTFLRWKAPRPRKVLYIDGEMSASSLQERLRSICASSTAPAETMQNLRIYTPDQQSDAVVDISDRKWHKALQEAIGDAELVIVDNLSCLARSGGPENEAESWLPLQGWGLLQRRLRKAVIFLHHSGKSGDQRGTSRREDILNSVISLRQPPDYKPENGALFEVRFEKGREVFGEAAKAFQAQLISTDEQSIWTVRDSEGATHERVVNLRDLGMKPEEIAQELSIGKSTVYRHLQESRRSGGMPKTDT